ncbi:phosphatase PAP2 family protein [Romboutsia weinsteinii]|uniref:Phosphatase PAP2 family protein n=1 Tax=Romboutsia weinsteinii TaxID=2020949 RepID=A0A371JAM3_9FIRM|nr:diacylglycerol kinase [Romboutsia weinsteinii]RDY29726.1 phosphatase PAP2 family protein [Romboutsia weinsteinii]
MKPGKTRQGITKAFNAAIEGILYTFKFERNMKIHYVMAAVILIASLFSGFDKIEMLLLIFSISLVIISEMFNTAIEKTIDMITDEYHVLAKIAKDVAAGGVLIAALNAVVVGYILFYDKLTNVSNSLFNMIRSSQLHVTLICIALVLIAVVVVKALTSTGTPLKGGMPSGHAALAFAFATIITFLINNTVVSTLAYLMALLVAQSRIEGKIHTFWETVAGALLGVLVAISVLQIGQFFPMRIH